MSAVAPQLLFALLMARPVAVKFTALTVTLDEPLSFKVTVRLALAVVSRRLMPLKPASRANWVTWPRTAVNWVAGPARTVVSVVCCAWLIKDWDACRGRRGGATRCAIGLRSSFTGELRRDAAHDAFRNRVRGGEHGQIHLQHRAEQVVPPAQFHSHRRSDPGRRRCSRVRSWSPPASPPR